MGNLLNSSDKITLINHVLQSIAIYKLAIMDPPTGVIRTTKSLFANFFWGQVEEKLKLHWVSWEKCCLPIMEGGLGIRSLTDIIKAYSLNLWWKIHSKDNLWTQFLKVKYCSHTHPCIVQSQGSHIWKRMVQVRTIAKQLINWKIGRGNCSIWHDSWLPNTTFIEPQNCPLQHVKELFRSTSELSQ